MAATIPKGIRFKKGLGQNLLLDDNINRIMVDAAALTAEDDVVEVGAGLGALTSKLCEGAGRVLAVEIDFDFMPFLEEQFAEVGNVILFRGDILNHNLDKFVDELLPGAGPIKMVSNLPYYITTPILFHFWESPRVVERSVVMVQEEVGMRMTAAVGASNYGILTLAAAYFGEVDIVHKVPASCFRPQPKVDSCIVRIRTHETPPYPDLDREFFFSVFRTAFSKRRKTLRNTLTRGAPLGVPDDEACDALRSAGIDPSQRPQTLSLDEYAAVARCLSEARTTT